MSQAGHYTSILPAHRGIAIHSRTLSIPLIQLINLSKPMPKPPCGAPPYFLNSRYHP